MEYWNDLITDKSFKSLKDLNKNYDFILIGGWAVFLYTQALKSKDIDIVLSFQQLSQLRKDFAVSKNERLKKYRMKREGVSLDIYLPYYSNPGLPAEDIKQFTIKKEGFTIPTSEVLLILKQRAFKARQDSVKGTKDKIDIFSLISLPNFNWKKYQDILSKYNKEEYIFQLKEIFKTTSAVKELNLSEHKTAKLKKKILSKLKK